MKIISTTDIKANVKMSELIDVAQKAYEMLYDGSATMPVRTISDLGEGNPILFYKPTCDNNSKEVVIKLLSQLKQTSDKGYPTIQGLVVMIDGEKNQILSMMNGGYLTALRTGAASGLATKLLAREDAQVLAVFGAGAQAYTQIEAVLAVRDIKKVVIFDLFDQAITRLINHFSYLEDIEFTKGDIAKDLPTADVICTVTNSKASLFDSSMLKEGVHINAIGSFSHDMRELPDDVFVDAALFVDHKESCFSESGDIIVPLEKGYINDSNYKGEIAELIFKEVEGRATADQRTIFKSVGVATQDLTVAQYIYNRSMEAGFGVEVEL